MFRSLVATWFLVWTGNALSAAEDTTRPLELRQTVTPHSMGLEWDIEGDADHDASCQVSYRRQGTSEWKRAMDLLRVDFRGWYAGTQANRNYNMLAGSVFFLEAAQRYEVKLDLTDPDGGTETKTLVVPTRTLPQMPKERRILHVTPGKGKGEGTEDKPFRGLEDAQKSAKPGDIFLLRAGRYGRFRFDKSGTPDDYIVWQAADEGDVSFVSIEIAGSHVWIEGFFLERAQSRCGLQAIGKTVDVVVRRNVFVGFPFSIMLNSASANWYINDNTIEGGGESGTLSEIGEGIDLGKSSGHTVAHNRISHTADGITYPKSNCDIFGNDLVDLSKDAIKPDYGYANIRIWENRMTNLGGYAVTFQPMYCGPWYFVRNQVCGADQLFKFRVQDRFVLVNNTFVGWSPFGDRMHHLLSSFARNNLYISAGKKTEDASTWMALDCRQPKYCLSNNYEPTWATDIDYDGIDWGDVATPFTWNNGEKRFESLESFSQAVGIEKHGRRVMMDSLFETGEFPLEPSPLVPQVLALRTTSDAIDAGEAVPNLADQYSGNAPDLGAHELDRAAPEYGPIEPNRAAPAN